MMSHASPPGDYGEPWSFPPHPVVGVSWYEALAFTRWLTDTLREAGQLEKTWGIRLPSELEWERAARGPDGIIYPWGNEEITPDRANYRESGVGTTTAVGCFPQGRSLTHGLEDAGGNVWEWTRTLWGSRFKAPYDATDGREDLAAGAAAWACVAWRLVLRR